MAAHRTWDRIRGSLTQISPRQTCRTQQIWQMIVILLLVISSYIWYYVILVISSLLYPMKFNGFPIKMDLGHWRHGCPSLCHFYVRLSAQQHCGLLDRHRPGRCSRGDLFAQRHRGLCLLDTAGSKSDQGWLWAPWCRTLSSFVNHCHLSYCTRTWNSWNFVRILGCWNAEPCNRDMAQGQDQSIPTLNSSVFILRHSSETAPQKPVARVAILDDRTLHFQGALLLFPTLGL